MGHPGVCVRKSSKKKPESFQGASGLGFAGSIIEHWSLIDGRAPVSVAPSETH